MNRPRGVQRREQRGSALLLAIFFLMLLFLLALALFRVVPSEMHSAGRSRQDLQAHYACSLGTKHAVKWLSAVVDTSAPNPPDVPGSIGNGAQTQNEPFRMDQAPADRQAYWNPGGNSTTESYNTDGNLARFNGSTGADFDGVSFGAKPYLVIRDDLQVGNWAVRTWIFPDRQTYPIPERFPGLLVNPGQPNGDSTVSLALRYYTIVSEAYPFGDPDNTQPRLRSKVTIGQQSFALYARFVDTWPGTTPYTATLGQKSVDGPFHTNSYFRIRPANNQYFNPGAAWNGVSSFVKMTYAGAPAQGQADIDWPNFSGRDGVAYKGGNFQNYGNDFLPWDGGGSDKTNAYEKLTGGRANLQGISAINLPTTTSDLQLAAWGFDTPNPVAGPEGGTTGIFVKNNGTSAQGGVYVKGDTREAVLGVANNIGTVNFRDTAVTQTGNPALMMQQSSAVTAALNPPILSVTNQNQTVDISTGVSVSTNISSNRVQTGSVWVPTTTQVPNAWSTTVTPSTQILYSVQTNYVTNTVAGGGGFGDEVVQVSTSYVSVSTGQSVVNVTNTQVVGYSNSVGSALSRQYSTNFTTNYITQTLYSQSVSTVPITNTISQSRFYPTDRVVEVNTIPMTLPTTFSGKILAQNGVPLSSPLNVGTGSVVVIKDSRTNGLQAEVQVLAGTLNGVVYSEDNIHNLHGVNKGKRTITTPLGEPGVSEGKNISIGVPVAERVNGQTYGSFRYPNNAPGGTSTSQSALRSNRRNSYNNGSSNASNHDRADILQWGTTPGTDPTSGGNALGLVAQRVGINIHRDDLNRVYQNNPNIAYTSSGRAPLRIYAVILAGRGGTDDDSNNVTSQKGGFRIFNLNDTTDLQSLTNGKDTISSNQYGYFKLFGGLIERRGAANWFVPDQGNPQGWDVQMSYDEWASKVPPPFFPTTSSFAAQLYMEEYPSATYQTSGQ